MLVRGGARIESLDFPRDGGAAASGIGGRCLGYQNVRAYALLLFENGHVVF